MKNKLENFWYKYRYDMCCMPAYVLFFTLIMTMGCGITNWRYWIFFILVIIFRWVGYKEGKLKIVKSILKYNRDIVCDIEDERVTPIICELKDVTQGVFFSLLNDKLSTKYIKTNMENEGSCECWNMTENKITLINNDSQCIVYKTKILYLPIISMKRK